LREEFRRRGKTEAFYFGLLEHLWNFAVCIRQLADYQLDLDPNGTTVAVQRLLQLGSRGLNLMEQIIALRGTADLVLPQNAVGLLGNLINAWGGADHLR
jgi:hypothetical protein